jgi:hypothetical protein
LLLPTALSVHHIHTAATIALLRALIQAIQENYRCYSFGDAMLILPTARRSLFIFVSWKEGDRGSLYNLKFRVGHFYSFGYNQSW